MRTFFVNQLRKLEKTDSKKLLSGVTPTQVTYIARGLAEWDAHVTKSLSEETVDALKLMFDVQLDSGAWGNVDCWPPLESDVYHGATVAALAVAAAPGWRAKYDRGEIATKIERLESYLRTETPPHDYARVWLLRVSARMPDLLSTKQRRELTEMIWRHQREDGGWSLRTFGTPETWGKGNRAKKLRAEKQFKNPLSDGHQTGLVITALREAGTAKGRPTHRARHRVAASAPASVRTLVDAFAEHRRAALHNV